MNSLCGKSAVKRFQKTISTCFLLAKGVGTKVYPFQDDEMVNNDYLMLEKKRNRKW